MIPWRTALSPTAGKIFALTALVLQTRFNMILTLISANLLTVKMLLDFYYLFYHNSIFTSRNKGYAFCCVH